MKNGYTKIFFSDPKSADLTSSKYKPSNNSEDHEEIKNVPHVFISFSCPLNATKRLETYVDFNILFADIRTVLILNTQRELPRHDNQMFGVFQKSLRQKGFNTNTSSSVS